MSVKTSNRKSAFLSVDEFYTPLADAIVEIQKRNRDAELKKSINTFLKGSIPEHFKAGPILYLSRHIASPNFETLRFIELCKEFPNLPSVIGQDLEDKFVSHNLMKRPLVKMPIVKGISHNKDYIIEFVSVADFSSIQGVKFKDIKTRFGKPLSQFHNELLRMVYPSVRIADESDWVTQNQRGNLIEHYKSFLALLIVHGVMFEFYLSKDPYENGFIQTVLHPAFLYVKEKFGYKPLIVRLVEPNMEENKTWDAYPSILYKTIRNMLNDTTAYTDPIVGYNYNDAKLI